MKQLFTATFITIFTTFSAIAQNTIQLPFYKSIGKTSSGSWESWPSTWSSSKKEFNYVPNLTIKKIDSDIFTVAIDFGGSSSGIFNANVVYDPTETAKIRTSNSNKNLTAYRYTGTKDYIWTENVTLAEVSSSINKWTSTPNAKLYTWEHSLGSASVYSGQASIQGAKKYTTNFISHKNKIKGTWGDWSGWSTVGKNTYFELKVITESRVYNFKYYENGKLVKDYNITYNDNKTQSSRDTYSKVACYKIDGTKDNWIYLLNTTMGNVFANPDKWSNENDAIILILDDEKTGKVSRIK